MAQVVDVRGELDDLIGIQNIAEQEPAGYAGGGADQPDEQSLQHEDRHDTAVRRADRLQNGYLPALFYDVHNQVAYYVERGHKDNQDEDDEHRELFESEGRKKVLVHLHPVHHKEGKTESVLEAFFDLRGLVYVPEPQLYARYFVLKPEKFLGRPDIGQHKVGIIFEHPDLEYGGDPELLHLRQHAHGPDLADRRHDVDLVADKDAKV